MPYNKNHIPDTPMTPGMLPRAITLHDSDFVILVQPINDPGQKCRTATLSQLAAYIAGGGISSIVFIGDNGFVATNSGNGFNYHKDATQEDQATRDFGIDDDGIHVTVTTSNYTKNFEMLADGVKYSKTASGLTNKVEIFEDYILITHQVQNGATVETHTSRVGWDSVRAPVLNVMQDENNLIPISWDVTNSEFVIWSRTNHGTVAVPKLHVYGTLNVEKDTNIDADVSITKSLTVGGRADFNGNFTVIKNLYATEYAELISLIVTGNAGFNADVSIAQALTVTGDASFNGSTTAVKNLSTEHADLKGVSNLDMDVSSTSAIILCSDSPNPTLPNNVPIGRRVLVVNNTGSIQRATYGNTYRDFFPREVLEFIHITEDANTGWYIIGNIAT